MLRSMNMTMSASCSMEPDSRRSDSIGRFLPRISTARDSCDSAMTGMSISFASTFRPREISPTSTARLPSLRDCGGDMSCR